MDIRTRLLNVQQRFNSFKSEKPKRLPEVQLNSVRDRFKSFVASQKEVTSLSAITRKVQDLPLITQSQIDKVGTRYKSFVDEKDNRVSDIGKRFGEFQAKLKQYGHEFDPMTLDPKAQINSNDGLVGKTRRFYFDNLMTPEERRGRELDERVRSGETLGQLEMKDYNNFKMNQAQQMALDSVSGIGTVGKVGSLAGTAGKKVLTQAQKKAIEKLPKIMYDLGEDAVKEADQIVKRSKTIDPVWKSEFKDWVNTRASSHFAGLKQKVSFKDLDDEGLVGIFRFQAGDKTGRYADVKKFFDSRYQQLQKAGVEFRYKQDYLPQLWVNSADEIEEKLGKHLTSRPSFSLKSILEDYQAGINKGLQPRFNTISDLINWYEKKTSKTLADQKFFKYLKDQNVITTEAKDWYSPISTEHFPAEILQEGSEIIRKPYYAPKEIARVINNYLVDPQGGWATFAKVATKVKNLGMSAGVPFTGLNFHGYNTFLRSVLASNNPAGSMFRSGRWMLKPSSAERFVHQNLDDAEYFVKNGLTISNSDYGLSSELEKIKTSGVLGKPLDAFESWFGDPLFKQVLPAMKLSYAKSLYADLLENLPKEKAVKIASENANTVFGGINLDQLMRSKQTQNVLRSLVFAPDWSESTIRLGKGVTQGILNPLSHEYRAYRVFARNMLFGYLSANILNKMMSGHWMFENEGNNKFNIDTNSFSEDGSKRYFRVFGTALDFVRLPVDVLTGLAKGDPHNFITTFTNRLSMPAGSIGHLVFNRDYALRPIYGQDQWRNAIPTEQDLAGVTNEVLRGIGVPTQVMAGVDFVSGRSNAEQALARAFEAPVKYAGSAYSKTDKAKKELFESLGYRGEKLANKIDESKSVRLSATKSEDKSLFNHITSRFKGVFSKEEPNKPEPQDALTKAFLADIAKDEQANRVREIFRLGLSQSETEKVLKNEKLGTFEEAQLIIMKSLGVENGVRGNYILEMTKGMDAESKEKTLLYLSENEILTTSVISKWLDDGTITEEESDYLKDLIITTKGTAKSGSKKKSSTKKVTAGSIPTIKITPFANSQQNTARISYRPQKIEFMESRELPREQRIQAPKPKMNFKSYKGGGN